MAHICTVSTVKDSLSNVNTFVERNLAAGADHMFIFLDDGDADIDRFYAGHDHVTTIRRGPEQSGDQWPASLNRRQVVNANVIHTLLTGFDDGGWLFHIDGDECLDVDRDALLARPEEDRVVHLQTLEAVAQLHWDRPVDRFKRPLQPHETNLLWLTGVIRKPSMRAYFNGHLRGKSGVRPSLGRKIRIHDVEDLARNKVNPSPSSGGNVLHYESYSCEEFVRKWSAHVSNEGASNFNARKDAMRSAVAGIAENPDLDPEQKSQLFREIFVRRVQDDLEKLDDLGLLVHLDPSRRQHRPEAFDPRESGQILTLLGRLLSADRRFFAVRRDARDPRELIGRIRRELRIRDRGLSKRLDMALKRPAAQSA